MGLKLEWVAFDDGSGAFANAGGLRLIAGKGGRWSVVALGNVDVSDSADNITAAQEAAEAAAAHHLQPRPHRPRGISLGHLSRTVISGVDVWSLPRVRRVDIDDATHWRPLGAGPEVGQ